MLIHVLVSEITYMYYVSSGTLNHTHSLSIKSLILWIGKLSSGLKYRRLSALRPVAVSGPDASGLQRAIAVMRRMTYVREVDTTEEEWQIDGEDVTSWLRQSSSELCCCRWYLSTFIQLACMSNSPLTPPDTVDRYDRRCVTLRIYTAGH